MFLLLRRREKLEAELEETVDGRVKAVVVWFLSILDIDSNKPSMQIYEGGFNVFHA